jgi:cyclopropane-fatty-acyl-phospholipid synthase
MSFELKGTKAMKNAAAKAIDWTEQGLVPDSVIRHGIRRLLGQRLDRIKADDCEFLASSKSAFIEEMDQSAIAPLPHKANEQHYELPSDFFLRVLGEHNKYSCCYWDGSVTDLDTAEADALRISCMHAGLENGMDVLELGCGWGSLTLYMARTFPDSRITAVSNSATQRDCINRLARQQNLHNVEVITCDMNEFSTPKQFDRIVSVEMFEHMRNYRALLERVSDWLKPGGRFFLHIFCHRDAPYAFEDRDETDWMSRHFFSGGIMPSHDLPLQFQDDLRLLRRYRWNGTHYEKTANAWLANMDLHREAVMPILADTYGQGEAERWWMRWRVFFMACAELFGYRDGEEWWVSHYLFERPAGD